MRITASPFAWSSAPDGSSASSRWRPPITAPGNGDALALAAGQLVGVTGRPIGETELFEDGHARGTSLSRTDAVELERKGDVLDGGQAGEEVELLEDVAHRAPAQPRLVVVRHLL